MDADCGTIVVEWQFKGLAERGSRTAGSTYYGVPPEAEQKYDLPSSFQLISAYFGNLYPDRLIYDQKQSLSTYLYFRTLVGVIYYVSSRISAVGIRLVKYNDEHKVVNFKHFTTTVVLTLQPWY